MKRTPSSHIRSPGSPFLYGECSMRLLIRLTVSSGLSAARVSGLLISAIPSWSIAHSSSLVRLDKSVALAIEDRFDPGRLLLPKAGLGKVRVGSPPSDVVEPEGESCKKYDSGMPAAGLGVIVRLGCLRVVAGEAKLLMGGMELASEGDLCPRVAE
jgi:hypothetical protein